MAARDLGLVLAPLSPDVETLGAFMEASLAAPADARRRHRGGGFRLMAGEIRDGHIRRVRGEPLPEERDEDEVDEDDSRPTAAAEQTEPKAGS